MSFIENFEAIGRAALHTYPRRVNAVFSANAWYYDEVFKRAAAGLSEQGAQLLGTQHGGNYGALQHMPSEDHETAIVDRYFSWGWGRSDCAAEVVPMPAGKLMGRELLGADNGAEGILWVATSAPRYLTQYPFLPEYFHDYLGWQQRFAIGLPGRLLDVMRFRPHYEDYGWGIVDRLQTHVPMLKVESWQRPFSESLRDCRLYVCDHLSTTFIEALAVNKPTILFWDPCVNRLRPEAQPYYDLLYSAGILFDTPEGAIKAIGEAYDDVESWWSAADRQHAVGEFCRRFAFTAPDALRLWSLALSNAQARPALAKSPLR